MNKRNSILKHYDFMVLDLICLIISFFVSYYLRHSNLNLFTFDIYRDMFFVIVVINILVCLFYGTYDNVLKRGYLIELRITIVNDSLSMLLSVLYLFIVKSSGEYSRITLILTYSIYFVFSYITRVLLKKYLKRKSINALTSGTKSLLIICKQNEIDEILENIKKNNFANYQITGICLIKNNKDIKEYEGYPIVSDIDELLNYISTNWIDDILVGSYYNEIPNSIIDGINETGIPIHVKIMNIDSFSNRKQVIEKFGNINVITAVNTTYSNTQVLIKRLFDIIGGFIGCIVTIILIIIIGPIIYIKSPGNIFYVSDRVGKNGRVFKFYKFRSMVLNADDLKNELKNENRVKDGMMFKLDNDPRIIPGIGNFIRKTSLDEFPQFFNVLKGDMSLVGTRPPTLDEWNRYSPYYRSRLTIMPGITGLWQVSGRSNITNFDEVVKLDNEYINNWSISLDIKILMKTILVVFNKEDNGAL